MPPKKGKAPAGGHQLAELMPPGEVLTDLFKKSWRLSSKLGQGGFGLIYLAHRADDTKGEPMFVIKQEPSGNGPLALECLFYAGILKPEKLEAWSRTKRVPQLGLPKFMGWGMHSFKGKNNRFLVMPRYGDDLHKRLIALRSFSRVAVSLIALRLIDALQYLHEHRYVHADIKAANILLPYTTAKNPPHPKTVYLVDFGLNTKHSNENGHVVYKQDPKRAHDGTVEFTSRDAHMGVKPSRRGDMEILGYCLLQWLCGGLPWQQKLTDKNWVANQKCQFMKDLPSFLRRCFPSTEVPKELHKYLELVNELEYTEEPDYVAFREIFKTYLRSQGVASDAGIPLAAGVSVDWKTQEETAPPTPKRGAKKTVAPKKTPLKKKPALKDSSEDSDATADESMSRAFPPNNKRTVAPKTGRGRAAKKNPIVEATDEDDSFEELQPSRSSAAASRSSTASRPSAASRISASKSSSDSKNAAASGKTTPSKASTSRAKPRRKRPAMDDLDEDDDDALPLREVDMNPTPGLLNGHFKESNDAAASKKATRMIKRRKNVTTSDGATQTTPRSSKRVKRS